MDAAAAQRGSRGLVAVALGEQAEDPHLVWREVVLGVCRRGGLNVRTAHVFHVRSGPAGR